MKTSLILFTTAATIPALVFVGLSATVALGTAAIVGVGAMLSLDYGKERTAHRSLYHVRATARARRAELHPLAA